MSTSQPTDVTQLLMACSDGHEGSLQKLMPLVYDELRRMAAGMLQGERPDHTLQPTALVHDAYLRLVDQRRVNWQSRRHFFAIAAQAMRRILVDHARSRCYAKRGGGKPDLSLEEAGEPVFERAPDLVALDDALKDFVAIDPHKVRIVELHFFAGFSLDETAEIVGCSRATVCRHWRMAKTWLHHRLSQ